MYVVHEVHQLYESRTIVICFTTRTGCTGRTGRTGCTVLVEVLTNDMQVTIVPRPVPPVNHCFTTCTDRTSRVKPFTGRICSTVLDKDG